MIKLFELVTTKDHVIWDWNGTLLSDLELSLAIVNRLLGEENLPAIDLARHRAEFCFPVSQYYEALGFDVSAKVFADLCARFNQHFHDGLDACALWPGARELLARVKASGRTQSLLSLTEHERLLANVAHFDLHDVFDHVVGNTDLLAASKVERGRELMARAAIDRDRTVLIGDTDHDLEVGRALGIEVILVEHGHQSSARLRGLHDRVVNVL